MNENQIKESWETVMGHEAPADFLALVKEYQRRKSMFGIEPFGTTDFVFCTFLYQVIKKKGAKKDE